LANGEQKEFLIGHTRFTIMPLRQRTGLNQPAVICHHYAGRSDSLFLWFTYRDLWHWFDRHFDTPPESQRLGTLNGVIYLQVENISDAANRPRPTKNLAASHLQHLPPARGEN